MEWNWLKRYRAWRASQKEFLAPENWLEPEVRDDKSPAFPPATQARSREPRQTKSDSDK